MKKKSRKYKPSFKHLFFRLSLSGVLSIGFFLLMFPFLQRAEGLPFEETARVGEINLWRIVFFYGFLTAIFILISFWKKLFRLSAIILVFCWLSGSIFVYFLSSSSSKIMTNPHPEFTGQEVFNAVNDYRTENDLGELELDEVLCNNLAQRYFDLKSGTEENIAHKGFDEWYEKYVKPHGYYATENYAWGQSPKDVIEAWEGSPGHRISVLDGKAKFGCSYAHEGHSILILGYKQINTSKTQAQIPSRTGQIIPYREWCSGEDISVYENELITKPSSDGNIYSMTQGDWNCYEDYIQKN